eukprot:4472564-Amphidinium_carterae.1
MIRTALCIAQDARSGQTVSMQKSDPQPLICVTRREALVAGRTALFPDKSFCLPLQLTDKGIKQGNIVSSAHRALCT